jgi:hypothetical protein
MRKSGWFFWAVTACLFLFLLPGPAAGQKNQNEANFSPQMALDQALLREKTYAENLAAYAPLAETYLQEFPPDTRQGVLPKKDYYSISQLTFTKGIESKPFLESSFFQRLWSRFGFGVIYRSAGFAEPMVFTQTSFDRSNYDFQYVRREFLGEVRCFVFDVTPTKKRPGDFMGRIWVEDRDYNIVRFNGAFVGDSRFRLFFHFDSYRENVKPGVWLPTYIYAEESDKVQGLLATRVRLRALTRIWGYERKQFRMDEFTSIQVEDPAGVKDETDPGKDLTPLEAMRSWRQQAEDNLLDRMQAAGVLAPKGEVDKVLQTVVNNLIVTNNLEIQPEVRCRVLLTTPLESFTVGHTIILSRGLIDVLPDEASLGAILAHELGHITASHSVDTKHAFHDRMIFEDYQVMRRISLKRNVAEEKEADEKGLAFLKNSPYKDKLENAYLFLRAAQKASRETPQLLRGHFGNSLELKKRAERMAAVAGSTPQDSAVPWDRITALPLGARVKVDSLTGKVAMAKSKPAPLYSPRDKLEFQLAPLSPFLYRMPPQPARVASASPGM